MTASATKRAKSGGRTKGTPNKPKLQAESPPAAAGEPAPFLTSARAREATAKPASDGAVGNRHPHAAPLSKFPRHRVMSIDQLVPYANNARTHSQAQIDKIVASIREFGFTNPVLTDGKRGIVAGHGRVIAAKQLGMAEVPVIELSHLSAKQRRAYVLADNRLALDAGWDSELLALELGELRDDGFDLALTGFDMDELGKLFDQKPHPAPERAAVTCPACGHEFTPE